MHFHGILFGFLGWLYEIEMWMCVSLEFFLWVVRKAKNKGVLGKQGSLMWFFGGEVVVVCVVKLVRKQRVSGRFNYAKVS